MSVSAPLRRQNRADEPGERQREATGRRLKNGAKKRTPFPPEWRCDRPGGEGGRVRGAARRPAVRDPQPVGRRLRAGSGRPRVPGAGDDELRFRLHARPSRRRCHARRDGRAHRCARPRDGASGLGRSRERLRRRSGKLRTRDRARRRGRRGRRLDRGLRPGGLPVRSGSRGRAGRRCSGDGARPRLPLHAHRPRREPHPRQSRPRGHDRAAAVVRGGRRRRALRARPAQRRRHSRGVRRGVEAGERARASRSVARGDRRLPARSA